MAQGRKTRGRDPALLDAPLTPAGAGQCRALAARPPPALAAAELVVVSPLTRALQTALLLFGGAAAG